MHRSIQKQRGTGLVDLVVVLALVALLVTAGASYAIPRLAVEELRGAVHTVQSQLQRARVEAVTRNHPCCFVLDSANRRVLVYDLNDPSVTTDDLLLTYASLPSKVVFGRPDSGAAITLEAVSGTLHQATFAPDGSVSSGAGVVTLQVGTGYHRIVLHGAGGVRSEVWTGGAWAVGS